MKSNNLINLFPKPVINLLGGEDKFSKYPIIDIPFKIDAPISVGIINDCPFFVLRISYRNKVYKEVFKQKSTNNNEIWECSSHSYIFSKNEYNIYYEDRYGDNDLKNIKNLVNRLGSVSIFNFTNSIGYGYDFFDENATLI